MTWAFETVGWHSHSCYMKYSYDHSSDVTFLSQMIRMSCPLKTVKHCGSAFGSCTNCSKYKLSTAKREKERTVKTRYFEFSGNTKQTFEIAVAPDNRGVKDWGVYLKENYSSASENAVSSISRGLIEHCHSAFKSGENG